MSEIKALCDQIREIAFQIHTYLGHGHLEKVYKNALFHRLLKAGFRVEQQKPIKVFDEDGTLIGDYLADLVVNDVLIVELKAAKSLAPEHEAQMLGYLKASHQEHGLLINFGSPKFEIRKFIWNENGPQRTQNTQRKDPLCSLWLLAFSFLLMWFPEELDMDVTREDVLRCAALAHLSLREEEIEPMRLAMARMLSHAASLDELQLEEVEPMLATLGRPLPRREDVPRDGFTQAEALANAPEQDRGYFVVPKVL